MDLHKEKSECMILIDPVTNSVKQLPFVNVLMGPRVPQKHGISLPPEFIPVLQD